MFQCERCEGTELALAAHFGDGCRTKKAVRPLSVCNRMIHLIELFCSLRLSIGMTRRIQKLPHCCLLKPTRAQISLRQNKTYKRKCPRYSLRPRKKRKTENAWQEYLSIKTKSGLSTIHRPTKEMSCSHSQRCHSYVIIVDQSVREIYKSKRFHPMPRSLKTVSTPNTLSSIWHSAFLGCLSLVKIRLQYPKG